MFYGVSAKNPQDHALGKETLEILDTFYPGHAWYVFVGGGIMAVFEQMGDGEEVKKHSARRDGQKKRNHPRGG
jgi:hypothetical protein